MSTDTSKKSCDYNTYKRVRYFHGMLLTERDFQEEQLYHQEKRKLANRMLHGWGVVCGLGVKPTKPDSSKVTITPGMALDCLGNEIVVNGTGATAGVRCGTRHGARLWWLLAGPSESPAGRADLG